MKTDRRNFLAGFGGILATAFIPVTFPTAADGTVIKPDWIGKPRIPDNWQKWAGGEFLDVSEEKMKQVEQQLKMTVQELVDYVFDDTPGPSSSTVPSWNNNGHETLLITRPIPDSFDYKYVVGFHRGTISNPESCSFFVSEVDGVQGIIRDFTDQTSNLSIRVDSSNNMAKYSTYIKRIEDGTKSNKNKLLLDK